MNFDTVKEYGAIALGAIMFALLISIIAFLGFIGHSFMSVGNDRKAISANLEVNRGLMVYDDNIVTRDDVLLALKKYTQEYNVIIQPTLTYNDVKNSDNTYTMSCDSSDICLNQDDPVENWNIDSLENVMITLLEQPFQMAGIIDGDIKYYARVERLEDSNEIDTITFTLMTNDEINNTNQHNP